MSSLNGVSVLIPCYNEVNAIANTLEQVHAVLKTISLPSEIVVIDDGSTDGTASKVDQTRFRLIAHEENIGYGAALVAGAHAARYDCIVITDADGTYPIKEIPTLVAQLEDADMVIGARVGSDVRIPLIRRPAKWVVTHLARYVTNTHIPDLNSGLRSIRRELWERFESIFPKGFSLTTTITLAALTNGYRVKYYSIDYHSRIGESKIKPIRDTMNFIMLILRTTLLFDPLRVFVPLSLIMMAGSGFVLALTIYLWKMHWIDQIWPSPTVMLFISSIQMMALGGIADLIIRTRK